MSYDHKFANITKLGVTYSKGIMGIYPQLSKWPNPPRKREAKRVLDQSERDLEQVLHDCQLLTKQNPKGKEAYYYKDRSRPNNWTEKINIPTNLALLIVQFQLRIPPDRQMALTLNVHSQEKNEGNKYIKTESTRKLSNFNVQWTKTLYQKN